MAFAVIATIGTRSGQPGLPPDGRRGVESVHLRHLAIHQDQVVREVLGLLDDRTAVVHDVHQATHPQPEGIISVSRSQIASPNPVPPYSREVEESTCENC